MAENNVIISAEEEAKLLKPIDEYVGKIICLSTFTLHD